MPDPAGEALREVRARLDEAHAAADRLVQEAQRPAEAGADRSRVPPRGWDTGQGDGRPSDLQVLLALLDGVRDAVPAELSRQLATAVRDVLLALRALIDWYIARLGEPAAGGAPVDVEDIPLD